MSFAAGFFQGRAARPDEARQLAPGFIEQPDEFRRRCLHQAHQSSPQFLQIGQGREFRDFGRLQRLPVEDTPP